MTATLDSALITANRALARQGRSFHWARTFLSPQHASRATRLYGFCRRLDDLADDGAANSQPQKAFGEIRIALATGQSNDAGICDGVRLFRECSIAPEIPNALLAGLVSGALITYAKLPPFIATLTMMSVARGLANILTEGRQIVGYPDWFTSLATVRHFLM